MFSVDLFGMSGEFEGPRGCVVKAGVARAFALFLLMGGAGEIVASGSHGSDDVGELLGLVEAALAVAFCGERDRDGDGAIKMFAICAEEIVAESSGEDGVTAVFPAGNVVFEEVVVSVKRDVVGDEIVPVRAFGPAAAVVAGSGVWLRAAASRAGGGVGSVGDGREVGGAGGAGARFSGGRFWGGVEERELGAALGAERVGAIEAEQVGKRAAGGARAGAVEADFVGGGVEIGEFHKGAGSFQGWGCGGCAVTLVCCAVALFCCAVTPFDCAVTLQCCAVTPIACTVAPIHCAVTLLLRCNDKRCRVALRRQRFIMIIQKCCCAAIAALQNIFYDFNSSLFQIVYSVTLFTIVN